MAINNQCVPHSLFSDFDIKLFKHGKHYRLYEKMGAHLLSKDGLDGVYFAVFAPMASAVRVIGDFNSWNGGHHLLFPRWDESGIWEGFIPRLKKGDIYKFEITSSLNNNVYHKTDPYGYLQEEAPKTASIIWDLAYKWQDNDWMHNRKDHMKLDAAYAVYEVHSTSWKIHYDGRLYSYDDLTEHLVPYVSDMGYTHVEFMPLTEHPFGGSWGYQSTGFFAPTSRQGDPQALMRMIDHFHQKGIGVILDWVPSHFPSDGHGLAFFDGSCVYEHPDPRKGYHPEWKSLIFNYGRNEVREFLISSALFWMDKYHIDGIRVDAVASILHLNYAREEGEWEPNEFGGTFNLDAVSFIKDLNRAVYDSFPGVQTIAEESTTFPKVSHSLEEGGLGFGMKWMMGWMNDTLEYFKADPLFRKGQHGILAFNMEYYYSEKYLLPFSHDEVVHGKAPMIYKMPGDDPAKFANLRLLYTYMYSHPGHKLLFMGNEWGQTREWNYQRELDWFLLKHDSHKGIQALVKDLNHLYQREKALFSSNYDNMGFQWVDYLDHDRSILIFIRRAKNGEELLVVLNFTPVEQKDYLIGVPISKNWELIFNSDDKKYDGNQMVLTELLEVQEQNMHNFDQSVSLDIAPLSGTIWKKQ